MVEIEYKKNTFTMNCKKLKAFFDNELEFYKYYRSGNSYLDYKYFFKRKI